MSRGTTLRNIRISDELWQAAQRVASIQGQSVSAIVRGALIEYLGDFEDSVGITEKLTFEPAAFTPADRLGGPDGSEFDSPLGTGEPVEIDNRA